MPILAENEPSAAPELDGERRAGLTRDAADHRSRIDDGELWDLASAEALTALYERELGLQSYVSDEDIATAGTLAAHTPVHERVRLEERLADIADRLESSLPGCTAPAGEALAVRFDLLEARIETALQSLATRSELEPLQGAAVRLDALAAVLDDARVRLDRLPDLESRLGEVLGLLSDERLAAVLGSAHAHAPDADRIAEKVARQLAPVAPPVPGEELMRLIADLAAERREHDAQIAATLDTMQQAMVRILDRVDTMEPDQDPLHDKPSADPARDEAPTDVDLPLPVPPALAEGARPADALVRERDPHAPAPAPVSATEPAPRTTIEKLRQAFIADAQRAKLRAEAEAEKARANALAAAAKSSHWAAARLDTALVKGIPVKRVLVAALGLIVVIQAANLLLARKPAAVAQPEATSASTVGSDAAGAPTTPDRGASGGSEPAPAPSDPSRRSDLDSPAGDAPRLATAAETVVASMLESAEATEAGSPGERDRDAAALPASLQAGEATAAEANAAAYSATRLLDLPRASVGPLSLRLAAANGNASAEFEVGARFAEGKGPSQDFKAAARWYQRSASRGFAQAQYRLGTLYERGLGVPSDLARASVWYRRAAEQGNVTAMHNFAVLSAGSAATAPDYGTAARWFQEAAERGLADSQYNLAVLHENGLGLPKNLQLAYTWFALAARSGDAEAARRRDEAKARLSPAELAAADEGASTWRAKPVDVLANDAHVAGDAWRKATPEASS